MKLLELTGCRFGRLVAIRRVAARKRRSYWLCRCDCGNETTAALSNLRGGQVRSCGCWKSGSNHDSPLHMKHGYARVGRRHPLYKTWNMMIQRCTNPKNTSYRYYGGRGIAVCDQWRQDFTTFLSDVGERPMGTTLDRIDNDGNYEPGNVRWATRSEQAENARMTPTKLEAVRANSEKARRASALARLASAST